MENIKEIAIGKVHYASGDVVAISPDGERRPLMTGDTVHRDEVIMTGADGAVHLDLPGQQVIELGNVQSVSLSAHAPDPLNADSSVDMGDASDTILPALQADVEAELIIEAIEALPAPGAGIETEEPAENSGFDGLPVLDLSGLIGDPKAGFETTAISSAPPLIEDDVSLEISGDPVITADIVVSDASGVTEADGVYLVYEVRLSNPVAADVLASLNTGGQATAGDDYETVLQYNRGTVLNPDWVELPDGGLTLPANASPVQVRVVVKDDDVTENDETVVLTATTTSDLVAAQSASGTGIITDDRATGNGNVDEEVRPNLQVIGGDSVREGNSSYARFTVQLNEPAAEDVAVTLALGAGGDSASHGVDYLVQYFTRSGEGTDASPYIYTAITNGELILLADGGGVDVYVNIRDDQQAEADETFTLTASTSSDLVTNKSDSATATIIDDRGTDNGNVDEDVRPNLQVIGGDLVREADSSYARFTVELDDPAAQDVAVTLSLGADGDSASHGIDYLAQYFTRSGEGTAANPYIYTEITNGELTLLAAGSGVDVYVNIRDDLLTEIDETFTLTATTDSDQVANKSDSGMATITDDLADNIDEDLPRLRISSTEASGDDVATEGAGDTVTFTVSRTPESVIDSRVQFDLSSSADGSVLEAEDIESIQINDSNGTVTLTAAEDIRSFLDNGRQLTLSGDASATVSILPYDDTLFEDAEGFGARLSDPSNAVVAVPKAYAEFHDNGDTSTGQSIVHESALSGGSGRNETEFDNNSEAGQVADKGVSIATGTLFVASGEALEEFEGQALQSGNNRIETDYGHIIVNKESGDYQYVLERPASVNGDVTETLSYKSTDGLTLNLDVKVIDDGPVAKDQAVSVPPSMEPAYRIVVILDLSNSMFDSGTNGQIKLDDGSITTRFELAQKGIVAMLEEYYQQSTDVRIQVVTFNGADSGEIAVDADNLNDAVKGVNAISSSNKGSGTYYSEAFGNAKTDF